LLYHQHNVGITLPNKQNLGCMFDDALHRNNLQYQKPSNLSRITIYDLIHVLVLNTSKQINASGLSKYTKLGAIETKQFQHD